jgi:hypothetical protein
MLEIGEQFLLDALTMAKLSAILNSLEISERINDAKNNK